jgi:1,2-phenylacetyl-CoA epoxidase PaaB subunit
MKPRHRRALVLSAAEHQALDTARAKFVEWRRVFHNNGAAVKDSELAALRKHARAFHKAVEPLLHHEGRGTMAKLIGLLRENLSVTELLQSDYRKRLEQAYELAIEIDLALAVGKGGVRKDRLVYVWIFHAADAWPKTPTAKGRFGQALLNYRHADVPLVGSIERVKSALIDWDRLRKKGG